MNDKIVLTKTTSAIFLAIVLVAGTFAAIFPSFIVGINAQSESDYGYNSYEKPSYRNNYYDEQPEYPSYKPDYKPAYQSYGKDDKRDKSKKDSSKADIKKLNCINTNLNINGNNAGNVSIGNKGQGYLGANSYSGYYYGYDKKQGKGFDCVINNNNTNTNIAISEGNQTILPDTITCEECFSKVLTPEKLASVNAILEGGFSFKIADQVLTINSLEELCESFQGKTAENIFVALSPTSIRTVITINDFLNIMFCLNDVLNLDSSVT